MEDKAFKLRAWDSINKVMHWQFLFMEIVSGNEEEIPSGIIFQSDKHEHDYSKWPPEKKTDYKLIVSEWLHAKDKDGVDIYSQDLLEVTNLADGSTWVGIADWGTRGCAMCWDINSLNENNKLSECEFFDSQEYDFRVIGNAFENREMVSHLIEVGAFAIP